MKVVATIVIVIVAMLHLGFLVLEMFYWDHEIGRKVFNLTPEVSAGSKVLAMNQGLYNGFLSAGLLWGVWRDNFAFKAFFLVCIVVAGVFGALTAKPTILFVQAMPALLALVLLRLSSQNP